MKECRECEAILQEYRAAFYEFWLNASPETRRACQSVAGLIGGTEADVEHLEDFARPFRPLTAEQLTREYRREAGSYAGKAQSGRIRKVVIRKIEHQLATGHSVNVHDS